MKCLVLLLALTACGEMARAASTCALTELYFARNNISADDSDGPGPLCRGQCCGRGREDSLRSHLRRLMGSRVSSATKPITELLLSTRRTLQDHLIALSHQSQNKTALLFAQVYRGYASRAHTPLASLYDDVRILIRSERDGEELGTPPPIDLEQSTRNFFRGIFPVAFHNMLKMEGKQFTQDYESCLRDAYQAVKPFGEIPDQLGASLVRSIKSARTLLQVLTLGANTLAASEQILMNSANDACSNALLKAVGCSRCKGHEARPCRNYCLNVSRGCIGSLVSELDGPWSGYVEGVERLPRVDADAMIRALDTRVSEAIMHALESHVLIEKKVKQECGAPITTESNTPQNSHGSFGAPRRDNLRAPPPDTELLQFAASLAANKRIFAGLADRLCDDAEFADEDNESCWNGESIGEYTKPLVPSSSLSDQRYNSEVTVGAPLDPRVSALGDRLRQARQVLSSQTWSGSNLQSAESIMQGDEAGEEGSGDRGYDDDVDYDSEGSGDEGSGESEPAIKTEDISVIKDSSSSTVIRPLSVTFLLVISSYLT